jgi:hypothetical protein
MVSHVIIKVYHLNIMVSRLIRVCHLKVLVVVSHDKCFTLYGSRCVLFPQNPLQKSVLRSKVCCPKLCNYHNHDSDIRQNRPVSVARHIPFFSSPPSLSVSPPSMLQGSHRSDLVLLHEPAKLHDG